MTPPEPSNSTTARPEHPNAEETEENHLENNIMKIINYLKEEMKNSFKEIEKKTNKKLDEISKSLKTANKKNQTCEENSSRVEN